MLEYNGTEYVMTEVMANMSDRDRTMVTEAWDNSGCTWEVQEENGGPVLVLVGSSGTLVYVYMYGQEVEEVQVTTYGMYYVDNSACCLAHAYGYGSCLGL